MNKKITLVALEEYTLCKLFSFKVDDQQDSEFFKFYKRLLAEGKGDDLAKIIYLLGKIGEKGAEERYFRAAGKRSDNLWELPDHYIFKSKYRLYCLRYGSSVILLGNGGEKATRTYQQDPVLNGYVEILQAIDRKIKLMQRARRIMILGKEVTGTLEFYINQ